MASNQAPQSSANSTTRITTVISDLFISHSTLAPDEYPSCIIGIYSCLLRCNECEHFLKFSPKLTTINSRTENFIRRLSDIEKKLNGECQLNIERCAITTGLCRWLNTNKNRFENILNELRNYLNERMKEEIPLPCPKTYGEFIERCRERNQMALEYDKYNRMRRFEFHDENETKHLINPLNLQTRVQQDFETFVNNTNPNLTEHVQLVNELQKLLQSSFIIIKHPSRVVTHSAQKNESVTADISCQLLCLLDQSHPRITIENITPVIRCLRKLNPTDDLDECYQQSAIEWKTYSLVTSSNNTRIFSYADLSKIHLNPISLISQQREKSSIGKPHYAPYIYCVEFHINIKIRFSCDESTHSYSVMIQSTPFGLITNTAQEEELFGKVFLEHLKHCKSMTPSTPSTSMDLTSEDIVNSIKRYFIHRTGIFPKPWTIPYIKAELDPLYNKDPESMNRFYDILAKILAQIDFMTKHPLLILFYDAGLFFGLCNSKDIEQGLHRSISYCQKSVCAMRFGSIHTMSKTKDIGIRVDILDKCCNSIRKCTFDPDKLSLEFGSFITKIGLGEAQCFESILCVTMRNPSQEFRYTLENINVFAKFYHSKKLEELYPPQRYNPIWSNFDSKENNRPQSFNPSSISTLSQNIPTTTTTTTTNPYPYTTNQSLQTMPLYPSQYHQMIQQQFYPSLQIQPMPATVLQSSMISSNYLENRQQQNNLTHVIIIYAPVNQTTMMMNEDAMKLISCHFPQLSSSVSSNHIYHLNLTSSSSSSSSQQLSNTFAETSESSFPNLSPTFSSADPSLISEPFMDDSTNFPW